ncbi:MAG: hypothetical protein MMC23_005348 [Stictis urceolatum]|nr:hypothetical protein [Stictis urceolata]
MAHLSISSVTLKPWICSSCRPTALAAVCSPRRGLQLRRHLQSESTSRERPAPFRKQLKEEAKLRKATKPKNGSQDTSSNDARLNAWKLTVGIEVHAQLNTERKLFSRAATAAASQPNINTALFDLALPGSQPRFETATLIPALRAALSLHCKVQRKSSFDRKHYFYPDQPSGYQITQYYSPFAKDGFITMDKHDDIASEEIGEVKVGIKQIQMEQDTAKTVQQPPDVALLDFNRVGHPLVEIITLPHLHHPKTAAACVRKIQQVLQAVSAVTTGMELGGLRADVNVSVRRRDGSEGQHSYHGVGGLGQRTEIKNLSSFKAVEDAIVAERDRQIGVLEAGGIIKGETRGWTLGSSETRKLRGKEGEVDYRYMPDPDLPPVIIGSSLVEHLEASLPMLPDEQARRLVNDYGLSMKDAKTLIALDGGLRLDYFQDVVSQCQRLEGSSKNLKLLRKAAANWTLMELGSLLSTNETEFTPEAVPAQSLADIIDNVSAKNITGKTAKQLLSMIFEGDTRSVTDIIEQEDLKIQHLSADEYASMARSLIEQNPEMTESVRKGQKGKMQWFVGQMIRQAQGKVDAERALEAVKAALE